ncbi:unannotated protein [freshwater metagenome]|uniref:Unannotated protein n=1 Tax=freshwater metagenome TaxID=449393 RepID=A0A6J7M7H7_9ZZZZ
MRLAGDEFGPNGHPGARHRALVSEISLVRCRDGFIVADEGNEFMALGQEMGGRGLGPCRIVGDDAVGVEPARLPIDEHQHKAAATLIGKVRLLPHRRSHDDGIHPALAEGDDEVLLPLWAFINTRREHCDASFAGDLFDPAVHGGEERIRDVFDDEPEGRGLAIRSAQVARREIVPVIELACRTLDLRDEVARHARLTIDHAGHGLQTHPGQCRDITHRGPRPMGGGYRVGIR